MYVKVPLPHGGQTYCSQMASVMATGRLCSVAYSVRLSLGCCKAAQRECLMNLFFCLNHEKRKNTDGRFSLWEPWKLIVRKGGVGINVSYTRCYQAYCRKGHQYRFRAQIFFFLFLKSKNRKIITDRDLYKKKSNTEVSNVKLTDKKNRGLIKWKTFQKA